MGRIGTKAIEIIGFLSSNTKQELEALEIEE